MAAAALIHLISLSMKAIPLLPSRPAEDVEGEPRAPRTGQNQFHFTPSSGEGGGQTAVGGHFLDHFG